jgi:hypothetical protein
MLQHLMRVYDVEREEPFERLHAVSYADFTSQRTQEGI